MLIKTLALCGALLAFDASPALAQPSAAPFLTAGRVIDAPSGFSEMCTSMAALCQSFAGAPATAQQHDSRAPDAPDASVPWLSPTSALASVPFDGLPVANREAPWDAQRITVTLPVSRLSAIDVSAFSLVPAAHASTPAQLAFGDDRRPPVAESIWTPIKGAQLAMASAARGPATAPAQPEAAHADAPLGDERGAQHLLVEVNRHVNGRVRQQDDQITYGKAELWRPSGDDRRATGDCEDIAIEKRKELIAAHFPADRLFFAVVYVREVGLHTVLVARLTSGDVVLDSRTPYITPWKQVPYNWLAVEQPGAPMVWHALT